MKGPAQIIIFRHAEKILFGQENGLSLKGKVRAELLSNLLIKKYPFMKAVYAAGTGPGDLSQRKIQTITPLIIKVLLYINAALAINTIHSATEVEEVAQEILTRPSFQCQTVLICWSHTQIPDLAKALGANNVPTIWPGDRFDLLWEIDVYNHRLNQVPQLLFKDDSPFVIPVH